MVGRESQVWLSGFPFGMLGKWWFYALRKEEECRIGRNLVKMFISFHHFYSLDSGFKCTIGCILLHNKFPKNLVKTRNIISEFGCSLASCLWLKVSKVAVKPLAEAAVIRMVDWGWSICLQEGSLLVMVEGVILTGCWRIVSFSLHVPLHRSAWVSWHSSWLTPEWAIQEKARRKPQCLVA